MGITNQMQKTSDSCILVERDKRRGNIYMDTLVGLVANYCDVRSDVVFIIRPAQKRQKNTANMQTNLKRGDQIITVGGLHGKIDAVDDQTIF